jgi:hypothetical protein
MKMLVVHDELGNIRSAAVMAGEPSPRAGLRLQRGEFVTEVEVADFGPEKLRRNPRALSENFRVDTANAVLVRKQR